ncbi:unnamed protein product [Macrosiphum euphorbiae]|uniref:DUF4806 domain-containing protein n=1 Tax=Macrosiphum euphorbiae TaxID=13131 RepID=A0AAV0YAB1_9HEMI|nr:unnamed protein product [Macrosiphum euphorbiae]
MWKVVHFLNDNSVEPVPDYWLNRENNRCAWPNNNHLAKKMRDNRVKPNSYDFTNYKCRVLSQNILSLNEAINKANKAQYTTELSDIEKGAKNVKRKRKTECFINSDQVQPSKITKATKRIFKKEGSISKNQNDEQDKDYYSQNKNINFAQIDNEENSEISSAVSSVDDSDLDKDYLPNIVQDECKEKDKDDFLQLKDYKFISNDDYSLTIECKQSSHNQQNASAVNTESVAPSILKPGDECDDVGTNLIPNVAQTIMMTTPPGPVKTSNDLKAVMSYLAYIKCEVNRISETQQEIIEILNNNNTQILQKTTDLLNCDNNEIDYFVMNWPITDDDGLLELENKDRIFYKLVVSELTRLGGKTLSRIINKMLKKVFDDTILIKFTYYGLRNKDNFHTLSINKAIFDAVRKSKQKSVSDEEIIISIGKYMTGAKGRIEQQNNKKNNS